MTQCFAGPNFSYVIGDVAEIPETTAKSWIKHGLAERADKAETELGNNLIEPAKADPDETVKPKNKK